MTALNPPIERVATSEQRFKAAIDAIEGVLWTNSPSGEMVGEQTGWASLTGQTFDQYQGYGWADAVHPDDAQPTIDAWQAAVAAKSMFEFEHRVRRHDGVWRLFAVRAVPIIDPDGTIIEWVGIHRDITGKRADALRLHQLAETVDSVFYVMELDEQRMAYVSRAYEDIWGRPRAELYANARSFVESVHPEDKPRVEAALQRQLAGHAEHIEYRVQTPAGDERTILDRPFFTIDPVSGARRIVGLASDITEFHQAQSLLARNAETFANLVVSNPFGIYVVDSAFRLVQISRGAQAVFAGIDPLIGRDFAEILRIVWAEPFASEAIGRFRHCLATGEPYVSQSMSEQRGNVDEIESYDWRIDRIVLPDGQYGVVCYFYDLSERNAYEAKLTEALADKDLLAREIDHRVKNNLTVVGSLLTMQRNASTSPETRAALDEAAARVTAVARVHERLHKSDRLGVVAFGAYLTDLCDDLARSMNRPDVDLECRAFDVDLPADQAMPLALIANELVTNAFKHGCAAGATKIWVTLTNERDALTLTVADDGAGMKSVPNSKTAGLGLKIVTALARQLRATLVLPKPGMTTVFSVSTAQTQV